jgi:FtsX-like permease family protein
MKFVPLLLANVARCKLRTAIAVCFFVPTLFLFGIALGSHGVFNNEVHSRFSSLVVGALIVTPVLVLHRLLLISVRERTVELGLLKAIGYSDAFILLLVMAEAELIALASAILAVLCAVLFGFHHLQNGARFSQFTSTPFTGILLVAMFQGSVAGLAPAFRAIRLDPVQVLRSARSRKAKVIAFDSIGHIHETKKSENRPFSARR